MKDRPESFLFPPGDGISKERLNISISLNIEATHKQPEEQLLTGRLIPGMSLKITIEERKLKGQRQPGA